MNMQNFCIEYSRITNPTLHSFSSAVQTFQTFSDECQLSIAHRVFKQCSECPPAAATHYESLLRNHMIAVNELLQKTIMHCIVHKVFQLDNVGQLWCVSRVAFQHCTRSIDIMHLVHLLLFFYIRIAV